MRTEFKTKEEGIKYFKQLGYNIKEGPNWFVVVPKKEEIEEYNSNYKYSNKPIRTCEICGIHFNYGRYISYKNCECHKVYVECLECGKYFKRNNINSIRESLINNLKVYCFDTKTCIRNYNYKESNCKKENPYINMKFKNKDEGINFFKNLNYKIIKGPNWFITTPEQKELNNNKQINECIFCGNKFNPFGGQQSCFECLLFVECSNPKCRKYVCKDTKGLLSLIKNKSEINKVCSRSCQISMEMTEIWKNDDGTRANISKESIKRAIQWGIDNPKERREISLKSLEFAYKAIRNLRDTDPEWTKWMNNICINNLQKANLYLDQHPEIRIENGKLTGAENIKKANEWYEKNPEKRKEICSKNIKKATEKNIWLWENDPEWVEKQIENCLKNVKKATEKNIWLWENDPEWVREMTNILTENIKKIKEERLNKIKESISKVPIVISKTSVDINNIEKLKKNDICGAYVIKAKFKEDIGTDKEGNVYSILVCKSKRIYDEIYWVLRVISQPEKQDRNAEWTTAKWWYISNLYYDFEFELLTDIKGVSEEEALLCETKYGCDNDLFVEFTGEVNGNNSNRIPKIDKHSYWNL